MDRLNIFATEEEMKRIKELHEIAKNTPVIAMSVKHGIEKGGFAGEADTALKTYVHKCALSHGLPEIQGYYGIDGGNKEFLKA